MDSKRPDKGLFKSESSTKSTDYPGMWRVPRNPDNCCIYRVPDSIRRVNPEAYTPQLLLIGPLHHSLKSQALKSRGDVTNTKSMGYLNMEAHKKFYLSEFAQRVDGKGTIDGFKRIIEENEEIIRESYSESTTWIESSEFVEMILHDSVFIMEFLLRFCYKVVIDYNLLIDPIFDDLCLERQTLARILHKYHNLLGDPITDGYCHIMTVYHDLFLLENQLPYFILEKLFDPILPTLNPNLTLRGIVVPFFGKAKTNSTFKHFTDLARCFRVETLPYIPQGRFKQTIEHMYNMDKLSSGGVKFEAVEDKFSLYVRFEKGCLKLPCLRVDDHFEMTLRNIMALEQCHYPFSAHVSNYVHFLDFLIDTDKDVDLLVEKGVIKNLIGENRSVAEMVNKLSLGIPFGGSYYYNIAVEVNAHYTNPLNRSRAVLKNVYFGNLWTGTATVAATLLLLMTFIQTIASIIQVMQNAKSSTK